MKLTDIDFGEIERDAIEGNLLHWIRDKATDKIADRVVEKYEELYEKHPEKAITISRSCLERLVITRLADRIIENYLEGYHK